MNKQNNYYYKQIEKIPLLSLEQERDLASKAFNGDKIAQNKLVEGNLRFVIKIAAKYSGQGLDFDDLVNEGNLGLIHASTKFDPKKNIKFTTYAVWWIRESIQKAIRETSTGIRFPAHRYRDMLDDKWKFASLEKEIAGGEDEGVTLGSLIKDEKALSPEDEWYNNAIKDCMWDFLDDLPEVQRQILIMRYGLNGADSMSLTEVGNFLGYTKERVRQLEKKAKIALETAYFDYCYDDYLAA